MSTGPKESPVFFGEVGFAAGLTGKTKANRPKKTESVEG
jgi:hypothetical protein